MYDLIIIGGGPAGLTAGIYASRAKLKTLLLEKNVLGGQVLNTERIENYPGYLDEIAGYELIEKMSQQAQKFGLEIQYKETVSITLTEKMFGVATNQGEFLAKAIIIATGAFPQKLNVPGEQEFIGKGVSYCATCDAPFYRDKITLVVGGGDSALEEALVLTKFAKKVIIAHRRDQFRGTKILQDRVLTQPKIEVVWNAVVIEIVGTNFVEKVVLKNVQNSNISEKIVDGIFVFVGTKPQTTFISNELVKKDEAGYILTNENMQSSYPGIFACGDARKKMLRQIVTACGEGATAAFAAQHYLES